MPPTDKTDLSVTMQHKSGTTAFWRDSIQEFAEQLTDRINIPDTGVFYKTTSMLGM